MFERWLRKLGWDQQSRQRARELAAQVEQLIDICDRRLRLLPSYQDALAPGMRTSQVYLSSLMTQLPSVLELSLHGFARDPRLGLLFSGPSSLLELLDGSDGLREFFLSASNGDEAWALLTMQRSETRRFGVAMENGDLRSDVAQIVVSFDGHRLMMPSPNWEAFQQRSGAHALDVLGSVIARQLSLMEQARQQLEAELARLQLRRMALQSSDCMIVDGQSGDDLPESLPAVDARLNEVRPQLDALREHASLEGLLQMVRQVLECPEDYFSLQSVTLRLNRMGIKLEGETDEGTALELEEVVLGKTQPIRRALMPVRIRREAIDELRRQFGNA
ncbi:hypothetical protein [Chromobacterium alticapitis]|uniref:Uncharacterized protein n=1 Tax=Chromobacterium alticapitis TaxID=2073169 RepID=A0A2S5DAV9_9NEIS|nr:hypothetical protein [Chromobacterium alticapitis]POZ60240.1 hypothetical protein C2I19_19985 [Chromobacterium alticapitis]